MMKKWLLFKVENFGEAIQDVLDVMEERKFVMKNSMFFGFLLKRILTQFLVKKFLRVAFTGHPFYNNSLPVDEKILKKTDKSYNIIDIGWYILYSNKQNSSDKIKKQKRTTQRIYI